MYNPMINQLVRKDLQLHKFITVLMTVIGLGGIGLMLVPNKVVFHMGVVLSVSMLLVLSCMLVINSLVNERKQHTLPFIMSLPISIFDYTLAKVLANCSAFLPAWMLLSAAILTLITSVAEIPNGVIPFTCIVLLEILATFFLLMAVALVTESEAWTIGVMTTCNICVSIFWFAVISLSGIGDYLGGEVAVWNSTALTIVALELLCIALFLGTTFYLQSKKTDFT